MSSSETSKQTVSTISTISSKFSSVLVTILQISAGLALLGVCTRIVTFFAEGKHSKWKEWVQKARRHGKQIGYWDFLSAKEREICMEIQFPEELETELKDVLGCTKAKKEVEARILRPFRQPVTYGNMRVVSLGALFYGEPGCGKTMMARALAKECGATFLNVSVSTFASKWVGESEETVSAIFRVAQRLQPTIIFIDEIDLALPRRDSREEYSRTLLSEFLTQWDGFRGRTTDRFMVLAATNRMDHIEKAILRRLPQQIEFELPNRAEREEILRHLLVLPTNDNNSGDLTLHKYVSKTNKYSTHDLHELVRLAFQYAQEENQTLIGDAHMEHALREFRPEHMEAKPHEEKKDASSLLSYTDPSSFQVPSTRSSFMGNPPLFSDLRIGSSPSSEPMIMIPLTSQNMALIQAFYSIQSNFQNERDRRDKEGTEPKETSE